MPFQATHTVAKRAPYFQTSPQQGRAPDGHLATGEEVQQLEQAGAYSRLQRKDGTSVYVETDQLKAIRSSTQPGLRTDPSGPQKSKHLDEVSLRYGQVDLPLHKSDKFIAVKPRPGISPEVLSEMAPKVAGSNAPSSRLGGFQLVNVEGQNAPAEETLDTLRASPTISAGTHVYYTSNDQVPFVPTGQIFIEFAAGTSAEQCQTLLEQHHLQIVETRGDRTVIAQVTKDSLNPIKTAKALQASPLVEVAEPDLATPAKLHAFALPADGRLLDQWHLENSGTHHGTSLGFTAGADARVVEAWKLAESIGSPNVVVGVIDDGFDLSHPDLSGEWKIVAPKDFTRNSANPLPDPMNEDWHGTACAGVAVGSADGTGIVGAAPRCRLMPIRWGRDLADTEIENWFAYAREQGAWVVSCSWGAAASRFSLSTRANRAIARCAKEGRDGLGTVICFAAGNEDRDINDPPSGSINGFAIHPDVIAVAASTSRDQRSHYSNFGDAICVCAPSSGAGGWGITTSDVMGQYSRGGQNFEAGYSPGAYTDDFGGTSSACPLVAGICALILSVRPSLTAKEVRSIIEQSARRIGDADSYNDGGHSRLFGFGCVNARSALERVRPGTALDQLAHAGGSHRTTHASRERRY